MYIEKDEVSVNMILVTYLPFYRLHEVLQYFVKNIEILQPKHNIVYVDNVYNERQNEIIKRIVPQDIEVVQGNWRNRGDTWFKILRDLHNFNEEMLVIDSDNIADPKLREINHVLLKDYKVYTIADYGVVGSLLNNFLRRSRYAGEIAIDGEKRPLYAYKIKPRTLKEFFSWKGSPFFIGPKQVVCLSKPLDEKVIEKVERAFSNVEPFLKNLISDETVLGVLLYLCGYEEIPWTYASYHYHHGSCQAALTRTYKNMIALAHMQFANGLIKEFGQNVFRLYKLKYMLSYMKNNPLLHL
jgi:hypothetical protein